jgi:phospholipid-binding lipoprotein MlaA
MKPWKSLPLPFIAALAGALMLAGCASGGPASGDNSAGNDPIEGLNRGIFAFNRGVDTVVLRPAGYVYREGVPTALKDRVRDFLNYLRTPIILANDLFQGEFDRAEITFRRFFINTILGVGIADVATSIGIPAHEEDFGQTLGAYGVGDGPYIVLPLLGPSNARDTVGLVVDFFLDPVRYAIQQSSFEELSYIRAGTDAVDRRSRTIELTDDLERNSLDYYATVRSLYKQRRDDLIRNGATPRGPGMQAFPGQSSSAN